MNGESKFVSEPDLQYLMASLSIDLRRCADVLDRVLRSFNKQSGIPDKIVAWNSRGGNFHEPLVFPDRGRFIVELTQSLTRDKQVLWTAALLEKKNEKERAPVLFIRMHSPSLDIPMRVEIPLRAVMKGGAALRGTYCVYLHALLASDKSEFVYYGITKRGWNIRFAEHTKAAVAEKSHRLFPKKLNELIDARAKHLSGSGDTNKPHLVGIISALTSVGLSKDAAMDAEEYLVEKYSLASSHPQGLNMIPGGRAGVAALYKLSTERPKDFTETEDRELALDQYLGSHPQSNISKPGIAMKWNDPDYAEAVICGRDNRLSGDQVRKIRYLAALGAGTGQIVEQLGALDEGQIRRVVAGRTYSRIR